MKILTWNINGIRASKIPLQELFDDLDADVICIQETKVTRDQLDERTAILEGYNSYYSFSKGRSGYSGVATYVRDTGTPWKAEEGLSGGFRSDKEEENIGCYGDQSDFSDEELQSLDSEGRTIITQHKIMSDDGEAKWLTIINVYCPRADPEREERAAFKQRFYQLLQIRAEALLESNSSVIVLGDVNTSHKRIDHCDPDDSEEFEQRPGRLFLDQFLWDPEAEQLISEKKIKLQSRTGGKFVDTFRYFHPNDRDVFTCWSTVTGARKTNYGTRIDYIFADNNLTKKGFKDCIVLPDVQGSDHCPVKAILTWELMPCKKCPSLCTKYFPEYSGKQQKLHTYFKQAKLIVETGSHSEDSRKENQALSSSSKQFQIENMQESDKQKEHLKRQCSATQKGSIAKKMKGDKQPSGGKQANLMSFFSSNNSGDKKNDKGILQNTEKRNTTEVTTTQMKRLDSGPIRTRNNEAINSWKNLLKGPPPAPLCDGHKEPCVLRTVKKEGPNLGKQFYVCSKPEGLKTNPDARCEHFEWVDKKRP